jgi:hypothetical protein
MPPVLRRPPASVRLPLVVVAGVVLALVLQLVRVAVHEVAPDVVTGRPLRGFWLGTGLAVLAWLPAGGWLLRRRRQRGLDPWFAGALAWGVLVCAIAVTPGGAAGRDLDRYNALLERGPAWLLGWTAAAWLTVSLLRTRQRTPR